MTPDQISLVRSSWPILEANADSLSTTFYAYLFSIDHGAARLFAHVDMEGQRMKLVQSLAVVVHALDDTDRLLPRSPPWRSATHAMALNFTISIAWARR